MDRCAPTVAVCRVHIGRDTQTICFIRPYAMRQWRLYLKRNRGHVATGSVTLTTKNSIGYYQCSQYTAYPAPLSDVARVIVSAVADAAVTPSGAAAVGLDVHGNNHSWFMISNNTFRGFTVTYACSVAPAVVSYTARVHSFLGLPW